MTPFLEVKDVRKTYGAIKAVDGVSLKVGPGEIVGVIGPNGSGKTTLFNSILGQIKPTSGHVEFCGENITGMSPLELFRLKHVAHLPAGSLSYGQQKLIDIAMAFMPAPRLVLLDEPCAGVNPSLVDQLHDLLVELNKTQGGSFVVIEHNMDFIMKLCPHVICMVEGKVLAEGPPVEVQSNRQVLDAYLGN